MFQANNIDIIKFILITQQTYLTIVARFCEVNLLEWAVVYLRTVQL